jgi:hypothetical protein
MGFVQTTYLGIGYGLKPCYGVAWKPSLAYASLFQGGRVEAKNPAPQMGA